MLWFGVLPATPIALQKWPPRHLALLPSHDSIDLPRRWVRRWLRHKPLRGRRRRRMLRLLWMADLRDIIDISALRCGTSVTSWTSALGPRFSTGFGILGGIAVAWTGGSCGKMMSMVSIMQVSASAKVGKARWIS